MDGRSLANVPVFASGLSTFPTSRFRGAHTSAYAASVANNIPPVTSRQLFIYTNIRAINGYATIMLTTAVACPLDSSASITHSQIHTNSTAAITRQMIASVSLHTGRYA